MADSIGPWQSMMVRMSRSRTITKKPTNFYTGDNVSSRNASWPSHLSGKNEAEHAHINVDLPSILTEVYTLYFDILMWCHFTSPLKN